MKLFIERRHLPGNEVHNLPTLINWSVFRTDSPVPEVPHQYRALGNLTLLPEESGTLLGILDAAPEIELHMTDVDNGDHL